MICLERIKLKNFSDLVSQGKPEANGKPKTEGESGEKLDSISPEEAPDDEDFDLEMAELEELNENESENEGEGRKLDTPSTPEKSSPDPSNFIRRSGREKKQFPCAVKNCSVVERSIDNILRHIKVNHPSHYAALITVKHSKVFKVCENCSFIFLCNESFDSHIDLNLCNGNKKFWQKFLKDDKFDELEMKILTENYEWKYSHLDLRRVKSKRRPQTPSKPVTGKVSPSRSTRPTTPSKSKSYSDSKISGTHIKWIFINLCEIYKKYYFVRFSSLLPRLVSTLFSISHFQDC